MFGDDHVWPHRSPHDNRIAVGTSVTVFTESDFRGESSEFSAQTDHAHLDQRFAGRIQSFQLSCQ